MRTNPTIAFSHDLLSIWLITVSTAVLHLYRDSRFWFKLLLSLFSSVVKRCSVCSLSWTAFTWCVIVCNSVKRFAFIHCTTINVYIMELQHLCFFAIIHSGGLTYWFLAFSLFVKYVYVCYATTAGLITDTWHEMVFLLILIFTSCIGRTHLLCATEVLT
jgi:hypothetical protein